MNRPNLQCFYQIVITLNIVSIILKTFHDVTSIYLPKKTDLWCALLTDYTDIRLGYNPGEKKKVSKASPPPLLFSQIAPWTRQWQRNSPWTKTHADREIKAEGGIEKHMAGTEQEMQHSILERSGAATEEKA